MKEFTKEEVKAHNTAKDLWVVISGVVYDITKFLHEHPGGEEVLLEQAGLDATDAFEDVGHSSDARELLVNYKVGVLKAAQEVSNSGAASAKKESKEVKKTNPKKISSDATPVYAFLAVIVLVIAYWFYKGH